MSIARPSPDPLYILRGTKCPISYLKFQNNDVLYSGNTEGIVHAWSMKTRRIVNTITAHPGHSCLWLDFVDDGKCMLTQGRNGTLKRWVMSESEWVEQGSISCATMGFCNSCIIDGGKLLAVPSDANSSVDLYDLDCMKVIGHLTPSETDKKAGMCMKLAASDGQLLVGYEDGSVALWDCQQPKMTVSRVKLHVDAVMCLDYNKATFSGVSGSADDQIVSWSVNTDGILKKDAVKVTNPGFSDCKVRADGKLVAFAGWDSNVRLFGGKHLKPLAVLNYHKDGTSCLTFSRDNLLACGAIDKLISLWNIY